MAGSFKCEPCNMEFQTQQDLERHKQEKHS